MTEASGFSSEPLTDNCREIFSRGDHLLIGVSPGNSYFSEDLLTRLFHWAACSFRQIDVVIPDAAQIDTLLALGYPPPRARQKSRASAARLRNRAARAWEAAGAASRRSFRVHLLSELADNPHYRALLRKTEDTWSHDPGTREAFLMTSRRVLRGYLKDVQPTEEQAAQAARYMIAETPLVLDAVSVFGVDSSAGVYHQPIDFVEWLFRGHGPLRPHPRQGFVLVRPRRADGDGEHR
jgi:cyclo(L-tyrosyl-L-tyrosyl) synthase